MIVTQIEAVSKTRSRIFLDGMFAFVLYKGELRKYHISEGKELKEEIVAEIREEILPKRAKLRAMNLLKSKQYTEKQLLEKLLQGGYDEEMAQKAVAYVKSYHYVDDTEYAYAYVACHTGKKSRKEIMNRLRQRGISEEEAVLAFQRLEEAGEATDEKEAIRKLLVKKHYNSQTADYQEKQHIYAYFYRRGFSLDTVRSVMGE